jgi:hypothetical protein
VDRLDTCVRQVMHAGSYSYVECSWFLPSRRCDGRGRLLSGTRCRAQIPSERQWPFRTPEARLLRKLCNLHQVGSTHTGKPCSGPQPSTPWVAPWQGCTNTQWHTCCWQSTSALLVRGMTCCKYYLVPVIEVNPVLTTHWFRCSGCWVLRWVLLFGKQ